MGGNRERLSRFMQVSVDTRQEHCWLAPPAVEHQRHLSSVTSGDGYSDDVVCPCSHLMDSDFFFVLFLFFLRSPAISLGFTTFG